MHAVETPPLTRAASTVLPIERRNPGARVRALISDFVTSGTAGSRPTGNLGEPWGEAESIIQEDLRLEAAGFWAFGYQFVKFLPVGATVVHD